MELENVIDIDVKLEETDTIGVKIQEAGPQGEKGLSAYEVYLEAGGTLTETEWLESLKGEAGYTPVRGDDFWTEEDIKAIEGHCNTFINQQIGIIEDGEY